MIKPLADPVPGPGENTPVAPTATAHVFPCVSPTPQGPEHQPGEAFYPPCPSPVVVVANNAVIDQLEGEGSRSVSSNHHRWGYMGLELVICLFPWGG